MAENKSEIKYCISESLFRFSIIMFTLSLLNKSLAISQNITGWYQEITSRWYYLAFLGIIILALSVYIRISYRWKQEWVIKNIFNKRFMIFIKYFGYAIILILFGSNLMKTIQTNWSVIVGILCILLGTYFGAYYIIKSLISEKEA